MKVKTKQLKQFSIGEYLKTNIFQCRIKQWIILRVIWKGQVSKMCKLLSWWSKRERSFQVVQSTNIPNNSKQSHLHNSLMKSQSEKPNRRFWENAWTPQLWTINIAVLNKSFTASISNLFQATQTHQRTDEKNTELINIPVNGEKIQNIERVKRQNVKCESMKRRRWVWLKSRKVSNLVKRLNWVERKR